MAERSRWTVGVGGAVARVTRLVGDHELAGDDRKRRYVLSFPAETPELSPGGVRNASVERRGDELAVTVPDGARLGRIRLRFDAGTLAVRLPGPTFGDALADAGRGDAKAARTVLNSVPSPASLPFRCGSFLDTDGVAEVVDAVAGASRRASDALHSVRYDVARTAAGSRVGLSAATAREFESFVARLDDADDVGTVDPLDALADAVVVAPDADAARTRLERLGYNPEEVAERDDGRFRAVLLAKRVLADGRRAAREQVRRRGAADGDYDRLTQRALNADYWERGAAWRDALAPAAERSVDEFSFVLANALHWSGAVARTDARYPELLHAAAADVAAAIDLAGVEGRARYARHLAAGHRHRSARNHDRAVAHFDRARDLAGEYDAPDAWDPLYSRSVVRANQYAAADHPERAVAVVEDALDALAGFDLPPNRRDEMLEHLRGQKREAEAAVEGDDPGVRRIHLESALEHYERVGFDRSVARVDRKLDRADRDADAAAERGPDVLRPNHGDADGRDAGESRDPGAVGQSEPVGSADPGVLPDEHGGRTGRDDREPDR